ncbi:MAG: hypothetical protein IKD93_07200 [Firmicutes bacterium]|nr:hypothetical protein [Bacillota bacterium]
MNRSRQPARRLERQRRQEQQRQNQQQPQQPPPPPDPRQYRQLLQQAGAQNLPAPPHDLAGLKQLLALYGPWLTPENRALLTQVVAGLEQGGDRDKLQALAAGLRQALAGGPPPGHGR